MTVSVLSSYSLIKDFAERTGDRCSCCGKFSLFAITFDDAAKTILRLCSNCDVEPALRFT